MAAISSANTPKQLDDELGDGKRRGGAGDDDDKDRQSPANSGAERGRIRDTSAGILGKFECKIR